MKSVINQNKNDFSSTIVSMEQHNEKLQAQLVDLAGKVFGFYTHLNEGDNAHSMGLIDLKNFLKNNAVEKLNFDAIVDQGYYKGSTVLHILVLTIPHKLIDILSPLMDRIQAQLNFHKKAPYGPNQDLTAFELTVKKSLINSPYYSPIYFEIFLKKLIELDYVNAQHLNSNLPGETNKNCTVLFHIVFKMLDADLFRLILSKPYFGELDFNAFSSKGDHQGKSVLYQLIHNISNYHFNQLKDLIQKIPLNKVNLNSIDTNVLSVFGLLCKIAATHIHWENFEALHYILQNVSPEKLNINEASPNGTTPLFYIAQCAAFNPELLITVFKKYNLTLDNLNAKRNDFEYTATVLWNIAMAANQHRELWDLLIDKFPLDTLDLSVKSFVNYKWGAVTLEQFLYNSNLGSSVREMQFKNQIWRAHDILEKWCDNDFSNAEKVNYLNSLLNNAENFAGENLKHNPDLYYKLIEFYNQFGLIERMKKIAKITPTDNPFYGQILFIVTHAIAYPILDNQNAGSDIEEAEKRTAQKIHKRERKTQLLSGIKQICAVQNQERSDLIKNLAFNYVYQDNKTTGLPQQQPWLDELQDNTKTLIFSLKLKRKNAKLEKENEQLMRANTELLNKLKIYEKNGIEQGAKN